MSASPGQLITNKTTAEIAKLISETTKLNTETMKLQKEIQWYPIVLVTALIVASVTLTKLFL